LETTEVYLERLQKVADSNFYEITKNSMRVKFWFGYYNSSTENDCGTTGCLLGELPLIFPEKWRFDNRGDPNFIDTLRGDNFLVSLQAMEFFGLSENQCYHLFYPNRQLIETYGGELLVESSTREEVIANLKIFIEKVKSGEVELGN
jgi:hypothetical protein